MAFDPVAEQKAAYDLIHKLPPKVQIGPYDFRIDVLDIYQSGKSDSHGECCAGECRISICSMIPARSLAVDVFLHECLHAIYSTYNLADEDKEERIVSSISTGLTALLRDNPWLIDWIKSAKL